MRLIQPAHRFISVSISSVFVRIAIAAMLASVVAAAQTGQSRHLAYDTYVDSTLLELSDLSVGIAVNAAGQACANKRNVPDGG
jgi:hypothetical protein